MTQNKTRDVNNPWAESPKPKPKPKRDISGIVLLNKPTGISSNHALQRVKRYYGAKKAGHTGSLDPLASGMLPICLGEATKFSQYLLASDKSYHVKAQLGIRTTTSDSEGEITDTRPVPDTLTLKEMDQVFEQFRGTTQQIPTMYSALKYQGQPLYKLARAGKTVPREARTITLSALELLSFEAEAGILEFTVSCSKGTYIRTLVDDFGEQLGCGAHVVALHRLHVGPYRHEMIDLEALEAAQSDYECLDAHLISVDTAVNHLPRVVLSVLDIEKIRKGQTVICESLAEQGLMTLYDKNNVFYGIVDCQETILKPKRLMATPVSVDQ